MSEEKESLWRRILKRYFINGLNGMALGLFCTLIVGLILKQIGSLIGGDVGNFIINAGTLASVCTGSAIGIGTAYCMNAPRLIIFSSAITGLLGANAAAFIGGTLIVDGAVTLTGAGDPLGAFLAVVFGVEIGRLVSGRTRQISRNAEQRHKAQSRQNQNQFRHPVFLSFR